MGNVIASSREGLDTSTDDLQKELLPHRDVDMNEDDGVATVENSLPDDNCSIYDEYRYNDDDEEVDPMRSVPTDMEYGRWLARQKSSSSSTTQENIRQDDVVVSCRHVVLSLCLFVTIVFAVGPLPLIWTNPLVAMYLTFFFVIASGLAYIWSSTAFGSNNERFEYLQRFRQSLPTNSI